MIYGIISFCISFCIGFFIGKLIRKKKNLQIIQIQKAGKHSIQTQCGEIVINNSCDDIPYQEIIIDNLVIKNGGNKNE